MLSGIIMKDTLVPVFAFTVYFLHKGWITPDLHCSLTGSFEGKIDLVSLQCYPCRNLPFVLYTRNTQRNDIQSTEAHLTKCHNQIRTSGFSLSTRPVS